MIVSRRGERARSVRTSDLEAQREARETAAPEPTDTIAPAIYRPGEDNARLEPALSGNRTPQRGSNSATFRDPMTLEQVFPGLRGAPGGSILALADKCSTSADRQEH